MPIREVHLTLNDVEERFSGSSISTDFLVLLLGTQRSSRNYRKMTFSAGRR